MWHRTQFLISKRFVYFWLPLFFFFSLFDLFIFLFFYSAALFCIPRWPLPLHGDGIHARWWLGELDEQLWRPREVGPLLHGWGSTGSGRNPRHGLHSQVTLNFFHPVLLLFVGLVFKLAAVRHIDVNSFLMENAVSYLCEAVLKVLYSSQVNVDNCFFYGSRQL